MSTINAAAENKAPTVSPQWAADRFTHMAVATAIHAISGSQRAPQDIFDYPTPDEQSRVKALVEDYIRAGTFPPSVDGCYSWGALGCVDLRPVEYVLCWNSADGTNSIPMGYSFPSREAAEAGIPAALEWMLEQEAGDDAWIRAGSWSVEEARA